MSEVKPPRPTKQIVLVVLLVGAVVLATLNPTSEDYQRFLEVQLGLALQRMEQEPSPRDTRFLRDLLRSEGKRVIEVLVRAHTTRRNFGLFSYFDTQALDVHVVVLGFAGRFIPVEGQDEVPRLLGRLTL
jgi:Domain of unknown function (DUF4359)